MEKISYYLFYEYPDFPCITPLQDTGKLYEESTTLFEEAAQAKLSGLLLTPFTLLYTGVIYKCGGVK